MFSTRAGRALKLLVNIEFIKYMKYAGALVSPNDITKYS
jgi:ABC-type metal ion transport system substrate-binding protein